MSSPHIVRTKLKPPAPGPLMISRPRLTADFDALVPGQVLIAAAPAGYGKTTGLVDACKAWRARGGNIAWLTLDQSDNDADRFATHLWVSLQPETTDMPLSERSLEEVFASIANGEAAGVVPRLLVMDDYHHITNPEIHAAVNQLVSNPPAQLNIVISSRSDPPLQISRLRINNRLLEWRTTNLAFNLNEITAYFKEALGLDLPPAKITKIQEITEGWAAGLQLAVLNLRNQAMKLDEDVVSAYFEQMSGKEDWIFDYLADEVFNQLHEDRQKFLLYTSILRRLSPSLCWSVSGQSDSYQHLRQLEHDGLFLMSLDKNRDWYRYHQLFANFLQARLVEEFPDLPPHLHSRAAEWFNRQGDRTEASFHAAKAADYQAQVSVSSNRSADQSQDQSPLLDPLTTRELEILKMVAAGASNQDIAATLVIGVGTVKSHLNHILSKLGARNRTEAVAIARSRMLLS